MILFGLMAILGLSRFMGLAWGFPYLFHPDENNIVISISSLQCPAFSLTHLENCFDPHFYAYGHLYVYLGYVLSRFLALLPWLNVPVYLLPTLSLRLIAAFSSILSGIYFYRLIKRDFKSTLIGLLGLWLFIFTPVFIQFAHFGTTESILILLLIMLLYYREKPIVSALLVGISAAIKISGLTLFIIPLSVIYFSHKSFSKRLKLIFKTGLLSLLVFVLLTPHYWLNFESFLNSMRYETQVANGGLPVFYTEQFGTAIPIVFPFLSIFPIAIGILLMLGGLAGLWPAFKQKKHALIISFFILFSYQNLLFAKWTRFFIYCYPFFIYFSLELLVWLRKRWPNISRFSLGTLILYQTIIGLATIRVFRQPDIRITASQWIENNIPRDAKIISESGNMVDVPLSSLYPRHQSFFLYDLDRNPSLAKTVFLALRKTDFVIVDSRRVFHNYSCYSFKQSKLTENQNCDAGEKYPMIQKYYQTLFNPDKYQLVKTFTRYPKFGFLEFPDENMEETWSVFDHPVIRIYKRL